MGMEPIESGDDVLAAPLQTNFDYLAAGKGVKQDTLSNLKAFAALTPTEPFMCWATDTKQLMFYCADTDIGDAGFIIVGGG